MRCETCNRKQVDVESRSDQHSVTWRQCDVTQIRNSASRSDEDNAVIDRNGMTTHLYVDSKHIDMKSPRLSKAVEEPKKIQASNADRYQICEA